MVGLVAHKTRGRSPSIVGVDGLIFVSLNTPKIVKCSTSFILRTPPIQWIFLSVQRKLIDMYHSILLEGEGVHRTAESESLKA